MAVKNDPKWGRMDSDTPLPGWHKGLFYFGGVFLILIGGGCVFSSCSLMEYGGGGTFFLILMGIGAIIGGIACFFAPKKEMEAWEDFHLEIEEERQKEAERLERKQEKYKNGQWSFPADFIKKCEKNEIFDVESERNFQKAKLIAEDVMEKVGVPAQYRAQYITRKALEKEFAKAEKSKLQKEIKETQKKEAELEKSNKAYSSCIGLDKSIKYCKDHIEEQKKILAECQANIDRVFSGGETIYRASKGKESSWAVHGGIASGIAGPAAGIAAAYDVERRNQEVRNRNNQLADTIIQMQTMSLNNLYKIKNTAEEKLEYWEKKLEDVKIRLVGDIKGKELMEKMSPQIVSVKKSITDNVLVEVKLTPPENLTIFDEVKADVDGSFKVEIYAENERVGAAFCALPFEGLSYAQTFKVVCSKLSKQSDNYTAKVVSHHLWAVESKNTWR